jgi:hypothetical protein
MVVWKIKALVDFRNMGIPECCFLFDLASSIPFFIIVYSLSQYLLLTLISQALSQWLHIKYYFLLVKFSKVYYFDI